MKATTNAKAIARLEYLGKMIAKYAHRWNESPSYRLTGWVDEYNDLRRDNREAFIAFCEKHDLAKDHNGHDCLA